MLVIAEAFRNVRSTGVGLSILGALVGLKEAEH